MFSMRLKTFRIWKSNVCKTKCMWRRRWGVGMGVVGWATEWAVALREGNFPLVQPSSGSQNVSTAIQGKYQNLILNTNTQTSPANTYLVQVFVPSLCICVPCLCSSIVPMFTCYLVSRQLSPILGVASFTSVRPTTSKDSSWFDFSL